MRRLASVDIADGFFAKMLSPGTHAYEVMAPGLPADARLVWIDAIDHGRAYRLLLESEAFKPVPEGTRPPRLEVKLR